MLLDKNQLTDMFGRFSFDKPDVRGIVYSDGTGSYRLDDIDDLVKGRDLYVSNKEYEVAKILNFLLALAEVEHKEVIYRHRPVIMHIELTDFCNCKCIMCSHAYSNNDGAKFADIFSIEKYLPTCRLIVINGVGEPFFHKSIVDILRKFKEYKVKVSTTSNLSYLPDGLLSVIPDVFLRISVSCDGAVPETFERIRRNDKMSTFIENSRRVRKAAPDLILHMAVTSMRQNLMESSGIVELAADIGFDEVRFGRLETNPLLDNEKDSLNNYPNLAAKTLQEALSLGEKLGIKVNIPVVFRGDYDEDKAAKEKELLSSTEMFHSEAFYESLNDKYIERKREHGFDFYSYKPKGVIKCEGICQWLALGSNINIHGQVRPCGEIIRELSDRDYNVEAVDVMNTEEQIDLRKIFNSGLLPDVCTNCSYLLSNEFYWCNIDIDDYYKYFKIDLNAGSNVK